MLPVAVLSVQWWQEEGVWQVSEITGQWNISVNIGKTACDTQPTTQLRILVRKAQQNDV